MRCVDVYTVYTCIMTCVTLFCLLQSPFLTMVNVSYCALEEQTLTLLLRSVRANCSLQILKMEGNNLTGKGTFILSKSCVHSMPRWLVMYSFLCMIFMYTSNTLGISMKVKNGEIVMYSVSYVSWSMAIFWPCVYILIGMWVMVCENVMSNELYMCIIQNMLHVHAWLSMCIIQCHVYMYIFVCVFDMYIILYVLYIHMHV